MPAAEHAIDCREIWPVAIAGKLNAVGEARPQIVHKINRGAGVAPADKPTDQKLAVGIKLTHYPQLTQTLGKKPELSRPLGYCPAGRFPPMPNRLIEFGACYEALRTQPLALYEEDPLCGSPAIRRRIGEIIAGAANPLLKSSY